MSEPDNGQKIHDFAMFSDNIVDCVSVVLALTPQGRSPSDAPGHKAAAGAAAAAAAAAGAVAAAAEAAAAEA